MAVAVVVVVVAVVGRERRPRAAEGVGVVPEERAVLLLLPWLLLLLMLRPSICILSAWMDALVDRLDSNACVPRDLHTAAADPDVTWLTYQPSCCPLRHSRPRLAGGGAGRAPARRPPRHVDDAFVGGFGLAFAVVRVGVVRVDG